MMNGQYADTMFVRKLLELADDFIVAGIAVCLASHLPDFLHGVNDDELGI